MVEFAKLSEEEAVHVGVIVNRATTLAPSLTALEVIMDLTAVHKHTPLDLEGLARASDQNLAHDVFGIRHHINRDTGELQDYFMPRYAVQKAAS